MHLTRRFFMAGLSLAATMAGAEDAVPSASERAVRLADSVDAHRLDLRDENGLQVPLSNWQGRWVVLNLWAPWCVACRDEMPSLQRLARRLDLEKMAIVPLGFDWRGDFWIRKFYRQAGITDLPVFLGDGANVQTVLGLSNLPTTAILDPDGRHVFTVAGEAIWDDAATISWLTSLYK